jgi:hypothetical protein
MNSLSFLILMNTFTNGKGSGKLYNIFKIIELITKNKYQLEYELSILTRYYFDYQCGTHFLPIYLDISSVAEENKR